MMPRLAAVLLVLGAGWASVATAQVSVNVNVVAPPPPAIVLPAPPTLVVVPGVPTVQYVPSIRADLFFYGRKWYYSHGGFWYVGPSWQGPWAPVVVTALPPAIVVVPVKYYKIPPGHLKKMQKGGPPGHVKAKGKGHH